MEMGKWHRPHCDSNMKMQPIAQLSIFIFPLHRIALDQIGSDAILSGAAIKIYFYN